MFRPNAPHTEKRAKSDVRSWKSWYFGLKTTFGGFQNRFGPPKNYMRAARVLKLPQVFNVGSKHRENVPAPARGWLPGGAYPQCRAL